MLSNHHDGHDLLKRPLMLTMLWIAPWLLIIASSAGNELVHTAGWTFGFAVMGIACVANARGCGRRHCFYTGPLFLLAALASVLYGTGIVHPGPDGWNWIGDIAGAGALLLCFALEPLFGRYAGGSPTNKS